MNDGVAVMDEPMSSGHFRAMALMFRIRDALRPPGRVLAEVPVEPGQSVLDYGCGPGGYALAAAEIVGPGGTVHAADIHRLAVERTMARARDRGLANVRCVRTGCATGLSDRSVDVVLLYDVYHSLSEPYTVLEELHRVLRPGGLLSVSDHHYERRELASAIEGTGLFRLVDRGEVTLTFLGVP